MLYTHNTFDFNHRNTLTYSSKSVLPFRFNAISSLRLSTYWPPFHEGEEVKGKEQNTWETLCRIITTMQGLRNIRIDILPRPTYDEEISRVLVPLKEVNISGRLEIHGPWSKHFRKTKLWEDAVRVYQLFQVLFPSGSHPITSKSII